MSPRLGLQKRQLWGFPTPTTTSSAKHGCTPFTLPSHGVLTLGASSVVTLTTNVVFQPECTGGSYEQSGGAGSDSVTDLFDPFYASTIPQIYAISASTIIAWMLIIVLCLTPRTYLFGSPAGGGGFLGGRGMISGASGGSPMVGVGRRPWLQKVAALTVAISLTIASADTFSVAEGQYDNGYMNANALRDEVAAGLEVRVVRVISDMFVWLAQVQTLIRLFPRHQEKLVIKWTGLALIFLGTIFGILNSFVFDTYRSRPRDFADAIPALSYLFQLALSLLYAALVIFFSFSKRRYAFYHPKMKNVGLVALLSLTAILVPVVFFVLDVSKPNLASWGTYVRWVGAAAASVVVWEWIDRIEALEGDERKDGILGREVFDGDEMLDVTPSKEITWLGNDDASSRDWPKGDGGLGPRSRTREVRRSTGRISYPPDVEGLPNPSVQRHCLNSQIWTGEPRSQRLSHGQHGLSLPRVSTASNSPAPTPSLATSTPGSRADSISTGSTVYAIRYHPVSESTPPIPEDASFTATTSSIDGHRESHDNNLSNSTQNVNPRISFQPAGPSKTVPGRAIASWRAATNPFKRRRASPPLEVSTAQILSETSDEPGNPFPESRAVAPQRIISRIEALASRPGLNLRRKIIERGTEKTLPVTVIPAQPRVRAWSQDSMPTAGRRELDLQDPQRSSTGGSFTSNGKGKGKERDGPSSAAGSTHDFLQESMHPRQAGNRLDGPDSIDFYMAGGHLPHATTSQSNLLQRSLQTEPIDACLHSQGRSSTEEGTHATTDHHSTATPISTVLANDPSSHASDTSPQAPRLTPAQASQNRISVPKAREDPLASITEAPALQMRSPSHSNDQSQQGNEHARFGDSATSSESESESESNSPAIRRSLDIG
ncbi:MAG: hypothetical protein M1819_000416 [Sarea resinae]|nr:MAG: hypothetical protein M1819_000416 [Sarea resinae]